ncbi:MAG TPA: TonB family protein, partial [Terriglobales bacterium]|nr:TonB family protein [Terriglobales bacterium]
DFPQQRSTYKSDAPQTSGSGQTIEAGSTPEDRARGNDPADQTKSARDWKPPTYLLLVLLALVGIGIGNYIHRHPISRWARTRPHEEAGPLPSPPADLNPPTTNGTLTSKHSAGVIEKLKLSRVTSTPKPVLLKKSISSNSPANSNLQQISADDVRLEEQLPSAPALSTSSGSDVTAVAAAQLTPAKLLRRVEPIFPDFAREAGLDGTILLSAIIARDGRLKDVKLVSGNRALATEAFRALREWRYRPYLLDGKPIEAETRIVMNFHR